MPQVQKNCIKKIWKLNLEELAIRVFKSFKCIEIEIVIVAEGKGLKGV